ncbi:MAG: SRPBCC domain-containing protein [Chitinophagaceae bacterium]|nr:SRPBCC domain-containing protein [Anaerolineae bacterium]
MKKFSASAEIKASPEKVWRILTDAPKYPNWDPGMIKLEGKIALGEKIIMHAKISPNRTFPTTVSEFVPNRKMVWSTGMPLGLFKDEITFTLVPLASDRVKFSLEEIFSGLILPIIGRNIPDMNATLAEFVTGLKAQAEKR